MALVDAFHREGIGVILDWVPSHFPYDYHGLYLFDGANTYEYADMRKGFHPDWNSYIFNYSRGGGQVFPDQQCAVLAGPLSCRWDPGGCGELDAKTELFAAGGGLGAE